MKLRKPKHLYFQLFGILLIAGTIGLGYYQYRWINTAAAVEEKRILDEMYVSTERALEAASDEVRVLISFSYVSQMDINNENWDDVNESIAFWKTQSRFPDLLVNILVIPAVAGEPYLLFNESEEGFVSTDSPPDFDLYERYLSVGSSADAFRRSYPPLLSKGYFIFPLSPAGDKSGDPSAFLAIQVDRELFYSEVLPEYLEKYIGRYGLRITEPGEVFYSNMGQGAAARAAELVIPVLPGLLLSSEGRPPRDEGRGESRTGDRAIENPISRFWFLKNLGFPGIDPGDFARREIRLHGPVLEVFYPDRPLESVMRWRMLSSLLLSAGTLVVLLAAYFVLYVLLRRADRLRGRERDFVTSMSHELRTPLSVINATSDNLARGIVNNPDRVKKYGNIIQTQSQRLGKMVESILFFSGMESMDVSSMHAEAVNLNSFFEELIRNLAPAAEEAGARIVLSKDTRINIVQSYPNALRIIAENLIVNSLHHGINEETGGEVRVVIRTRPPRLLFLIIEDDGPGVPPGEVKRIFEPFARGERSRSGQVPGSGLGLHIVRRVSTQLGGQVAVESPYAEMAGAMRQGARFTVKIPVRMEV